MSIDEHANSIKVKACKSALLLSSSLRFLPFDRCRVPRQIEGLTDDLAEEGFQQRVETLTVTGKLWFDDIKVIN